MFDSSGAQKRLFRQKTEREDGLPDADSLRETCLHPAEAWVLKRRANRPALALRRLPTVARAD